MDFGFQGGGAGLEDVTIITNEDPISDLKFDNNYWPDQTKYLDLSSGDITFSLNTGVTNVVGKTNYFQILADGVHSVNLGSGVKWNGSMPDDIDGKVLDAGIYICYAIYSSDGIIINIPLNQVKDISLPAISTQPASSITDINAVGNGNISDLGGFPIISHGMVWSTSQNPTLSDSYSDEGSTSSTGAFTSNITGISVGTIYYVRAYITNSVGITIYGEQIGFTAGASIILMQDDFSDDSIDSSKWNTPTLPSGVTLTEASSALTLAITSGTQSSYVYGVYSNSFPDDVIVINAIMDWDASGVSAINIGYCLTTALNNENLSFIYRGTPASNWDEATGVVRESDVALYNTLLGVYTGERFKIKHTRSSGETIFSYWNGSSWSVLGTVSSVDYDLLRFFTMRLNNTNSYGYLSISDFYMTKEDYATETP